MNKLQKLSNDFLDSNFDSAIIISPHNRRYFTDFNSSIGYLFVTKDISYLLVDFRYIESAKKNAKNCNIILIDNLEKTLSEIIKKHNIKTTFLESDSISLTVANKLNKILEKNNVTAFLNKNLDNYISKIRMIKTPDEINKIKIAQSITETALNHIVNNIKPGITEKELALDLEIYMRKLGAEKIAFDLIVVSGKNSSLPHGVPSDRTLKNRDFVTFDIGAVYDGYHSDMTRTLAIKSVSPEQKSIYDIVLKAQTKAIEAIAPGVVCSKIDNIARNIIYDSGYKGYFGHSTGHSVGIEIHENPVFSKNCECVLEPGMVMTVEPGIYIPNKFGVRIEDMILVTESGFENLTTTEKDLVIL